MKLVPELSHSFVSHFSEISPYLERRLARESWLRDELPDMGQPVQLRAVDHVGTFVLPFLCELTEDGWVNAQTKEVLAAQIVAWRVPDQRQRLKTYVGSPNVR